MGELGSPRAAVAPHCVTSRMRDVAGLFLCWELRSVETPLLPRPGFIRLNSWLCSRAPPSQGRYWFTLVLGLVQTPGEHPSSASAGRNHGPFQLAGKCPLKLAFLGKSRFSQANPLVGLCVESWGGFCCSHAAPEERGLPGPGPRAG